MKYQEGEDLILMATATLSKWGNSTGIRIPNQIMKHLNLEEGIEVEIMITPENDILLRPLNKPQETNEDLRAHLKELLSKIKPNSPRHDEIDFGVEGDELI
ncbi:AbrB/MazE/SpoVT family DNA-binding domain-containing protein [Paenibacillus sp. FSL R5-0527]|uniref:AbrB/MazE/SpoVT family DNA-binding domain-containing protein n=1 Tax=Paenibacillus sp. FSL R5-0527 TaxID=2975321 RepID=UPI00097A84E0|nr:ppGpp-regulated growth inhibitor (ChpA/MazF) [Paenibacillus macerans]